MRCVMNIKPGLKCTEFWIALAILVAANVFGAMSPSIAAKFPENEVLQTTIPIVGILLAALVDVFVGLGWIVARTSLKKNAGK